MTELTLLSPPETARMLAVMDQLTCHTTSLNLCSSLGDHVLPEASSQVQMNTRPSWEKKAGVRRWGQQSSQVTSSLSGSVLDLFRNRGRESGQTTAKDLLAVSSFDNRFPAQHPCLYPFSPETHFRLGRSLPGPFPHTSFRDGLCQHCCFSNFPWDIPTCAKSPPGFGFQ